MKVSIIVPVYNVEKYVERCINSILEQTFEDYEVIIVDDGSTDLSGQICDRYTEHSKVKVYHKNNGGLSSARNYGIVRARGEFIAFVDSDDYLSPDYLKYLVEAIVDNDADMAMCRYTRSENDFSEKKTDVKIESAKNILKKILYQRDQSLYSVAAWNKLYKSSCFNELQFPEGKLNEDMFIVCEALNQCSKIAVCNNKLYYYRVNMNSITQSEFAPRNMDVIDACNHIIEYIKRNYPDNKNLLLASYSLIFRRSFQMIVKLWRTKQKYAKEEVVLKKQLIKYKKAVLFDPFSKVSTKIAAVSIVIGVPFTKKITMLKNSFGKIT